MFVRSKTYRSIALCLAALMFFTSLGITIDLHYCSGQLKTFSLTGKARSCHEIAPCPHHQKAMPDDNDSSNCCNNETVHIQADLDQLTFSGDKLTGDVLPAIALVAPITLQPIGQDIRTSTPRYLHYKPPLLLRDIPVLVQSFLL